MSVSKASGLLPSKRTLAHLKAHLWHHSCTHSTPSHDTLKQNAAKTKELRIDFRRMQTPPEPFCIKGVEVVRDDTYKYLGIVNDPKLKWNENTESMMKRINPRMYCLRKFKKRILF